MKRIKICCKEMEWHIHVNNISILDNQVIIAFKGYIGTYMHSKYCPFCGKKIELVDKDSFYFSEHKKQPSPSMPLDKAERIMKKYDIIVN